MVPSVRRPDARSTPHRGENPWWTQSGTQVTIQVNAGLSYEGTLIGGHTITGTGTTSDDHWNVRMLREPAPGELICR